MDSEDSIRVRASFPQFRTGCSAMAAKKAGRPGPGAEVGGGLWSAPGCGISEERFFGKRRRRDAGPGGGKVSAPPGLADIHGSPCGKRRGGL